MGLRAGLNTEARGKNPLPLSGSNPRSQETILPELPQLRLIGGELKFLGEICFINVVFEPLTRIIVRSRCCLSEVIIYFPLQRIV
jgi:hypothetical protein